MTHCSIRVLTLASLCMGAVALATLTLGLSTDFWIHTSEVTTPVIGNMTYEDIKSTLSMHMGLWRVCLVTTILNTSTRNCLLIAYFSQEQGRIDQAEISMSISRATRFSAPFPVLAEGLIVFAFIFDVIGGIKRNSKAVAAAVLYILSGLSIAAGLILYISAINDEVSYGMRVKEDGNAFRYGYGWSFYFTAGAFIASEIAAVLCVSFYVKINASTRNILRLIPGLDIKHNKWKATQEDEQCLQPHSRLHRHSNSTLIL